MTGILRGFLHLESISIRIEGDLCLNMKLRTIIIMKVIVLCHFRITQENEKCHFRRMIDYHQTVRPP